MSVNIYLHSSHLPRIVCYILMIRCEHCDVDAYYRLTIEDFDSAEVYSADLCIKCIRTESQRLFVISRNEVPKDRTSTFHPY